MDFAELVPFYRKFLIGGGNGKTPAMYLDNEELTDLSVLDTFSIRPRTVLFLRISDKGRPLRKQSFHLFLAPVLSQALRRLVMSFV